MPYKLRKAPKQDKFWVVNKVTGKKYSYEPLPHETASRQMKALYAQESGYKINLKGGSAADDIAKKVLLDLKLKASADKQREERNANGDYTGGGFIYYPGTTDEVKDKIWAELYDTYRYKPRDIGFDFFDYLNQGFKTFAKVSGLQSIFDTVGALGNIFKDIFTGQFANLSNSGAALVVALDELSKQIPAVNVVAAAGRLIDKAVKGEEVTQDDLIDLGLSVADTISTLATAGQSKAVATGVKAATREAVETGAKTAVKTTAKEVTQEAIEESIQQKIINDIKTRLKDGTKEALKEAGQRIIFEHFLKMNPEIEASLYKYTSPVRNEDYYVVLDEKYPSEDLVEGMEMIAPYEVAQREFFIAENGVDRQQVDGFFKKWFFYNNENGAAPANYNPETGDVSNYAQLSQYDKVALNQEKLDKIAENDAAIEAAVPILEQIRLDLETTYLSPDGVVDVRKAGDTKIPVDGVIAKYDEELNSNAVINEVKKVVAEIQSQLNDVIVEQDTQDSNFIQEAINQVNESRGELVYDVMDDILTAIGKNGGTLTLQMYNDLNNIADETARQDITKYVTDTITRAINRKYTEDGTQLTDEEKITIIEDLKSGLAQAIQDDVLTAASKLTYNSRVKNIEELKKKADEAIPRIKELQDKIKALNDKIVSANSKLQAEFEEYIATAPQYNPMSPKYDPYFGSYDTYPDKINAKYDTTKEQRELRTLQKELDSLVSSTITPYETAYNKIKQDVGIQTTPVGKPVVVKTAEQIRRELGIQPALAKNIIPAMVTKGKKEKIQPALSRNVPVAPTVLTPPIQISEEKVMTAPPKTQFALLEKDLGSEQLQLLSEQDRALREIQKYDKERQSGVIQSYAPAIEKELKGYDVTPVVESRQSRVRQPKTRLFGKRAATVPSSRRFGK